MGVYRVCNSVTSQEDSVHAYNEFKECVCPPGTQFASHEKEVFRSAKTWFLYIGYRFAAIWFEASPDELMDSFRKKLPSPGWLQKTNQYIHAGP